MEKNKEIVTLDTEDETVDSNDNENRPYEVIDLDNNDEDEIVFVAVVDSLPNEKLYSCVANTSQCTSNKRNSIITPQKKVQVINLDCDNDKPDEATSVAREPYVIDVEAEINEDLEDSNYTLRIDDSPPEPNIIDVEDEDIPNEKQNIVEAMENEIGAFNSEALETSSNGDSMEAEVHIESSDAQAEADRSIDDYDARMREHFRLELSAFEDEQPEPKQIEMNDATYDSNTEQSNENVTVQEPNQSTECFDLNHSYPSVCDSEMMECSDDEDVIEIKDEDESGDDCVITSPLVYDVGSSYRQSSDKSNSSFTTVATIDVEKDEGDNIPKRKKITETASEIFRRMMPCAVPGVVSLFAPERHCLPENIRPLKFCYYYFITAHVVVKEIQKNEFYNMKDQMLVAKKVIHPCTCLSHPLNKNASRITLLTNPQSLFHRSHCYFAQNSRNSKKEKSEGVKKHKGPRRLTYQVSFNRIPQKREGKDFKDWNDVVIRRRQNASGTPAWSPATEKENKIRHQPFQCKSEADSWDDGVKMEPTDESVAVKSES